MPLLYHASPVPGLRTLEPRISNHGIPQVYFSRKRENVLVYLCNAIEKYARETNFPYTGPWEKWGPYGFSKDGRLRLEEYYPHATKDTYQGVSAYIYCVEETSSMHPLPDIPDAVVSPEPVAVKSCEWIPDAYEEIQKALREELNTLVSYEQGSEAWHRQIETLLREDYENAAGHPEYRHFLEGKFPFLHF